MSRTQTKCFLGSAILHGLLLALLVISSAFVNKPPRVEDKPLLKFFRAPEVTDEPTPNVGGGAPVVEPVPAQPIQQPPPVTPQVVEPKPVVQQKPAPVVKQPDPEPPPVVKPKEQPLKTQERHHPAPPDLTKIKLPKNPDTKITPIKPVEKPKPQVDLTIKKPNPDDKIRKERELAARKAREKEERERLAEEARAAIEQQRATDAAIAKANDDARRSAAETVNSLRNIASNLSKNTSGAVAVDMPDAGSGAFVNYSQMVWSLYNQAWRAPETGSGVSARVEIIVGRDGTILSAQLIDRSGDAAMDKSIRQALERVSKLPAFPTGAKDERRTFRITFNLKAKRQLG